MLVTQKDARRLLAEQYPGMTAIRLTTTTQVAVRPCYETDLGMPSLAWRKVCPGKDSAVRIGILLPNSTIDWDWGR
ncbi:MAG: hypothetical protein A2286_00065 [Gammaproteobacteria bacterium RIFOXYA12_FULL_61_12]|nr:MAG: hypothetical protein A2514_11405 [Gammaproteobacteria bacterium RIFOXYD12_FULL_61_37]OGT90762.1 MAG: hypothetical protein A2286_00065 [Gammaproteobacteria bacterium RIFOXYA12_FULL_61_12]